MTAALTPEVAEFAGLVAGELNAGLAMFWETAAVVLKDSPVRLNAPKPACFSLENNFFSALFLYSFIRGKIPAERRIYYAAANQCLRGMVTGCDNILDNEYKMTLDTDLPEQAEKFRSVLDIMVADRVLNALMFKGAAAGLFTMDQVLKADIASLHALLKSGVQEASEEKGVEKAMAPDALLADIHSVKTGILFQAPWALPEALEGKAGPAGIKAGLFLIGLGCQVLDDMVDLAMDVVMQRHNYVRSLVCHEPRARETLALDLERGEVRGEDRDFLNRFPDVRQQAMDKAVHLLETGCGRLFAPEHAGLTPFAVDFFMTRIGADRFREPSA